MPLRRPLVDVARARGAMRRLESAGDGNFTSAPHPRPPWVHLGGLTRAAALPARRPEMGAMASQRFAEICNLSDSEEEDLYPIDQPDPPPQPGMPAQRVKVSVDI